MSEHDPTRIMQGRNDKPSLRGRLPEGFVLHHTYEIVRLIGSGGMGDVYEARHLLSQDRYAIKVIRSDLVDDERVSGMFIRESEILKRIRHDAVVNYGGLLQDEQGRGFLVMDYIDGPSLRDRLRQKPLSADEGKRLLTRVATGLAEVHAAGTFHRDLSPDNILLPNEDIDRAVIIDFGIAKLSEPDAKTFVGGDIAGKYGYISPEQLGVIESPVDARSDIYSLGLVVAAALRGEPLEMGTNWGAVVEARKQVPKLDECPKPLRPLLASMLAPKPEDRPASMNAVLERLGKTRGTQAQTRAPGQQASSKSGGGFRKAAITVLILLAIGGVGFAGYRFMGAPPVLVDPDMMENLPTAETPTTDDSPLASEPVEPARTDGIDTAQLQALVDSVPCAALNVSMDDSGVVTLRGKVASAETQMALARQFQSIEGIGGFQDEVIVTPQPACEAVAMVNSVTQPAGIPLQFNKADQIYREGDYLVILVSNNTAEERHFQVDFYDPSGDVYHLRPNPLQPETLLPADAVARIGVEPAEMSPNVRHYRLGAPYGQATVIVMATDQPLFADPRPEAEPAGDYLEDLRAALDTLAESNIVTNWQTLEIVP